VVVDPSYRIVSARIPRVDIFERVADPDDLEAVIALEALANPRIREQAGGLHLVPKEQRVVGPGSTFIMAPFAYPRVSRFSDGSYGVYYAATQLETAIAETTYHRESFMRDTNEPPIDLDMRVIEARIRGDLLDLTRAPNRKAILDPNDYGASQTFARKKRAGDCDGLHYPSVRRRGGFCVAVFKPNLVSGAHTTQYLGYRWDGTAIIDVFKKLSLSDRYPGARGGRGKHRKRKPLDKLAVTGGAPA